MPPDETNEAQAQDQPQQPDPSLRSLDFLVGEWELRGRESGPEGEIHGKLVFEWMDGGFYLVQRVEIDYIGREIRGNEYIGYDERNQNLRSYFFSNEGPGPFGGVAIEYVWEVGDDSLTISGGEVGSPASFKGEVSESRRTISGRWEWPGGGYEATMRRAG